MEAYIAANFWMLVIWSTLGTAFIFWFTDNAEPSDDLSLQGIVVILVSGPAIWCGLVGGLIYLLAWGEDGTPKT